MIPAWADSVLMYWGKQVAYEDSGLDQDLISDLQAWDTSYCEGFRNGRWQSKALRKAHELEGRRLAHRVAEAIGRDFSVEFDGQSARSPHKPTTPAAAGALKAHRNQRAAELRELHEFAMSRTEHQTPGQGAPVDECPVTQPGQWLRDVRSRTVRRVRVRVSPDHFVGFPVEVVVDGEPGYVDAEMLGISESLRHELEELQKWWEQHAWDDDDDDDRDDDVQDPGRIRWGQEHARLVQSLQLELGDDFYVT
jgi:hypothetical protein